MEEEKYATFQVVVVNECAQFPNINIQIVLIPYKDSEGINGRKLKKYLELYLKCSKKRAKNFAVTTGEAISKLNGEVVFQGSASLFIFYDADGNEVKFKDVKDPKVRTVSDDMKITIPKEPAMRFFSCVIEAYSTSD